MDLILNFTTHHLFRITISKSPSLRVNTSGKPHLNSDEKPFLRYQISGTTNPRKNKKETTLSCLFTSTDLAIAWPKSHLIRPFWLCTITIHTAIYGLSSEIFAILEEGSCFALPVLIFSITFETVHSSRYIIFSGWFYSVEKWACSLTHYVVEWEKEHKWGHLILRTFFIQS